MKEILFTLLVFISALSFGQGTHTKTQTAKDSSTQTASTQYVDKAVALAGSGVSDFENLPQIKKYYYANGLTASHNTANYTPQTVDEAQALFNTTRTGTGASTDFGGWLFSGTSGDSIQLSAPIGVIIGNSIAEGHPALHGRLHPSGTVGFQSNYPDATGQISYELRNLTHMRWYNQGIGGQTSTDIRNRFLRDALGIASNPNDSRGSVSTLPRTPQIIILEIGINDFFAGTAVSVVETNVIWMVATAQEYGIPIVVFNCPGDQLSSQATLIKIAQYNKWLASGALNVYGATVYDFNKWWNGPGNTNNFVGNGMLADDIHPTQAGYDSLAIDLFNKVKLPVLNKCIFINEIAGGFSGYSRPANITINGIGGYTITKSTDTLAITSYVGDSVWINVISSTNVSGTSVSGFSSILWGLSNNQNNETWVARRPVSYGPQNTDPVFASINIQAPDYTIRNVVSIRDVTGSTIFGAQIGSTWKLYFGALSAVNSPSGSQADFSFTGTMGITGSIKSGGSGSIFGQLQIGNTSTAGTTGFGVGVFGGGVWIETSAFTSLRYWGGISVAVPNSTSFFNIQEATSNYTVANNSIHWSTIMNPSLNNTTTDHFGTYIVLGMTPIITSQNGVRVLNITNTVGDNLFNTTSGRTFAGYDDLANGYSAVLGGNSVHQGFLPPRMTTAGRDSIGYISSVTISGGSWTVPPVISFSGGTGTGAKGVCYIVTGTTIGVYISDHGIGYKTSSTVTGTLTGGTGSGGTVTVNQSGPDNGLQIFCTDCTATDASTGVLQTWSSSASSWKNSW